MVCEWENERTQNMIRILPVTKHCDTLTITVTDECNKTSQNNYNAIKGSFPICTLTPDLFSACNTCTGTCARSLQIHPWVFKISISLYRHA